MDASQSWQHFLVIFYIFLSCSCMRLVDDFHRKKEMEPFSFCPLKIQLLVVEGKDPGFNMSTISLPRARKDQRKHELASVIFYIKNSCYPFKMMGCLRVPNQLSCWPKSSPGVPQQNCNENQIDIKIIPNNSYCVVQWDRQDEEYWLLDKYPSSDSTDHESVD